MKRLEKCLLEGVYLFHAHCVFFGENFRHNMTQPLFYLLRFWCICADSWREKESPAANPKDHQALRGAGARVKRRFVLLSEA